MTKQWATRVIVAFQSACWCVAILLLLSRGISNLQASFASPAPRKEFNHLTNATITTVDRRSRGYALGVGLIMVAVLMIVASPIILIARACDRRRYRSVVSIQLYLIKNVLTFSTGTDWVKYKVSGPLMWKPVFNSWYLQYLETVHKTINDVTYWKQ